MQAYAHVGSVHTAPGNHDQYLLVALTLLQMEYTTSVATVVTSDCIDIFQPAADTPRPTVHMSTYQYMAFAVKGISRK